MPSNSATHGTFTRKQANALFAAYKCGDVFMTRKQINSMYALIGYAYKDMTEEQRKLRAQFRDALDYIQSCEFDLAQKRINGKSVDEAEYAADVDRFNAWNMEPEFISIEPTFNGYRIVC